MRPRLDRRSMALGAAALVTLVALAACGSGSGAGGSTPSAGDRMALGTDNPAEGDCTTNTSETSSSVGYVVIDLTSSSFQAQIQVQSGSPSTTYGIFMQQVPGSCPQESANGGTLTTDASGHGQASASVPRVAGASTFFVQLVSTGSGPAEYTSDRLTSGS